MTTASIQARRADGSMWTTERPLFQCYRAGVTSGRGSVAAIEKATYPHGTRLSEPFLFHMLFYPQNHHIVIRNHGVERLGQPTGVGVSKAIYASGATKGMPKSYTGGYQWLMGGAGHKMKLMLAKDLNLYNNTNNHTELVS